MEAGLEEIKYLIPLNKVSHGPTYALEASRYVYSSSCQNTLEYWKLDVQVLVVSR